jgi:hypothetical protein
MKTSFKLGIVLLAGIMIIYSTCKKSDDQSGKTLSPKVVSSQVASNLAQTLYGGFGGFSINDGLNPPAEMGKPGRSVSSFNNHKPACGIKYDTTLSYNLNLDTAHTSISGILKFTTICTQYMPTGITVYDSLLFTVNSDRMITNYNLKQNITMSSVNPPNPYSKLTLNGALGIQGKILYKTGSKKRGTTLFSYKFSDISIDPMSGGDIISGSATFQTKGDTQGGNWDSLGTILFLGGRLVQITIDGKTYTLNTQTGKIL